jgi:hypothetical protein
MLKILISTDGKIIVEASPLDRIWGVGLLENNSNRVVQKLQFLNNNHLKTAKCGAFCKTCSIINRVIEQVQYRKS